MPNRDLDAAAITDPGERAGFAAARASNARHGRSFYLATWLLQPWQRPYIHALYGFARYADDIVDEGDPTIRTQRFTDFRGQVEHELVWEQTSTPLIRALIATRRRWNLPISYFTDFLNAMQSDLTINRYETYDDLHRYIWGSAGVIALQVLPILGRVDTSVPWTDIAPFAADLGIAFQLTNFIRDVSDDLHRGRIYLPQESLRKFDLTSAQLAREVMDDSVRALLAFEIDRTRRMYSRALPGIDLVAPESRDCLRVAAKLYGAILDEIEAANYDVFSKRHVVGLPRRLQLGGPALARGLLRSITQTAVGQSGRTPPPLSGDHSIPTA